MKVCVIGNVYSYCNMFLKKGHTVVKDLASADLVCFTGGEDVSPHLYGEQPHRKTTYNSARDAAESCYYRVCLKARIPMVGICRGAQLLNVLNGGRLFQHVDNHDKYHEIYDYMMKSSFHVTSMHHQMMRPSYKAQVISGAYGLSNKVEYMQGCTCRSRWEKFLNPEVVFYNETMSLCFQPHPEFNEGSTRDYFFTLLNVYLSFK